MNFEKQMRKHGNAVLDALVPNPYSAKPSFPLWAKIALPVGSAALAGALALGLFLPSLLNSNLAPTDPQTSNPASSSLVTDQASAFLFAIPERLTLAGVTYQSVFSSDLGRIEADKAGEIVEQGEPYAAMVKKGYEAEFEKEHPGMPYIVSSSFGSYSPNYVYFFEVEGYSPSEVIAIMDDLYVAFSLTTPEEFTLENRTYKCTHSLDLGVLDPNREGESAMPGNRYAGMVKEGYEKRFETDYPRLPYFVSPAESFSKRLNFVLLFSIRGVEESQALYFEGMIYRAE